MSLDFHSLSAELLARAEALCSEWLPAGKRRGREFVVGDLQGNPGESLSINLHTGVWKDFSSGEGGGDFISLYAAMHRIEQGEAFRQLTNGHAPAALSRPAQRKPAAPDLAIVLPVPDDAPVCRLVHPTHGKPSASWAYRDKFGALLGHVARYDPPEGRKQIVPWVWADGKGWVMKQFPDPRPLYGLERLTLGMRVIVTEGEKAADAAQAIVGERYAVVTWPGGAQALGKADFSVLAGHKVLLWPDADEPGVECMRKLAAKLAPQCPEVKVLDVADMPDGWDAADCGFGWSEFLAWARPRARVFEAPAAKPPAPPIQPADLTAPPSGDRPLIFNSMPMKTAEMFHDAEPGRILFWRGEFYSWDGCRYVTRDRVWIEQRLYHYMSGCNTWKVDPKTGDHEVIAYNPKAANVNDVVHALRAVCYADLPEPQCWIEAKPGDPPAHEIVAFQNCFLHWPTRTMLEPTDRMFLVNALEFDYNPEALTPVDWLSFLGALWPDDPESITALAEMFGYMLTDDTSQHKMFMLIGPPRSGKGTILRVLESLVGYPNRVSPSLSSIGTQFGLQPLIGKRLAMISDARLSGRADQQPIIENLLRISGEDTLTIDRKNLTSWSGKLPTRFVLATNELPAFSDASAALANRFLIFRFTESFLGREDHGLTSRLLRDLPGIVLWALDGLERLRERGYLVQPQSAEEVASDLLEQTSPIQTFVTERCVLGSGNMVDRDELYTAWKRWCEDQGRDHPGTKVSFGRQLGAAFPGVKRAQPRMVGTGSDSASCARLSMYSGVRLRHDWEK